MLDQLHPCAALVRLTHGGHSARLRLKPADDGGTYDRASGCWQYPPTLPFEIPLPVTLPVGAGLTVTLSSTEQLCRLTRKGDDACTCHPKPCAAAVLTNVCLTCSFDCTALVSNGKTIAEAGFCEHGSTAGHELLSAVLLSRIGSGLPAFFAAGRGRRTKKAQVYVADGGCSKEGVPWFGWAFCEHFSCCFPGPEGGESTCGAEVHVGAKPGDSSRLLVAFSNPHNHLSGLCSGACGETMGKRSCEPCLDAGLLPLPMPSPGLGLGLGGAVELFANRCTMTTGDVSSPSLLLTAACTRALPAELLYRNCKRVGASCKNWSDVLAAERRRRLLEDGVRPVPPPEMGGPHTSLGRAMEELARTLRSAVAVKAHASPLSQMGLCEGMMDKSDPEQSHVLFVNVAPDISIGLTSMDRIRTLLMLDEVPQGSYVGSACDYTGGIVNVSWLETQFLLFSLVVPTPGDTGSHSVFMMLTNSKSASTLQSGLARFKQAVDRAGDVNWRPRSIITDDDAAETEALNNLFNNCGIRTVISTLETLLKNLEEEVNQAGWKGMSYEQLRAAGAVLPLVGLNTPSDGSPARLLLTHGIMIPFLCQGHALKATLDHALFGAYFKGFDVSTRHYIAWLMVLLHRRAITCSDFAGPLNWRELRSYSDAVAALLSTETAEVDKPFAEGLGLVRVATVADRKPGRPQPTHVLLISWPPGSDSFATVRIFDGEIEAEDALDVSAEVQAAVAAALGGSAGAAYTPRTVISLTEQENYMPLLPDEEDDALADGGGGGADGGDDALAQGAAPSAAASTSQSAVRLPTFFRARSRQRGEVKPLALSWVLRDKDLLRAGATFRTEFPAMFTGHNCTSTVEQSWGYLKHTQLAGSLPFKSLTVATQQLARVMAGSDAALFQRWAMEGDPVNQLRFNRLKAGAARRDAAAAAAARAATASEAGEADEEAADEEEEGWEEEEEEEEGGGAAAAEGQTAWGTSRSRARTATAAPSQRGLGSQRDAPAAVAAAEEEVQWRTAAREKQAAAAAKAAAVAAKSAGLARQKEEAEEVARRALQVAQASAAQGAYVHGVQSEAAVAAGLRIGGMCASCHGRVRNLACPRGACSGACCKAQRMRTAASSQTAAACPAGTHRG